MLLFLDTEFSNYARPDLISIGIARVDGEDFYAEVTDYPDANCSDFVRTEIIPLLGKAPGAVCTALELAGRLRTWFDALPEPATILFDFEVDWQLLQAVFAGDLPPNLCAHELVNHKIFRTAPYKLGEVLTYSAAWPPHHALADAQALREGFLRWQAAMSGRVWNTRNKPAPQR